MEFVNAYNFIPVQKEHAVSYTDTDEHTGVIEYSITTRSPLFVPNTSSDQAFKRWGSTVPGKEHKSYDFFSYNTLEQGVDYENRKFEPVIPGSELRGMFRSIYETLTNSCMGVLNEDLVPVKRTLEVFKAGLIAKTDGIYTLMAAEDVIFHVVDPQKTRNPKNPAHKRIFDDYENYPYEEGTLLYFNKITRDKGKPHTHEVHLTKESGDNAEGYLIRGEGDGSIGNKKNCHLFVNRNKKICILEDADLKRLEDVIQSYQDQPKQSELYSRYKKALRKFKKEDGSALFPVYYSEISSNGKKYLYLSPAAITKESANKSVGDLAGNLKPCRHKNGMCPACSLFGMTGENNEEAVASKIRVSDAVLDKEFSKGNCYGPITTLETLGSPKVSNSEFYLIKQDEGDTFWTFDYRINKERVLAYDAQIRGRKFYWHQPDKHLPKVDERTDQNKTIRPVKSNVVFHGKLYYERISQKQLDQLIWILNGGNKSDQVGKGEIAYKLGGGKPLGLGSVICKVTAVTERTVTFENGNIRYQMDSKETAAKKYVEVDGFVQDLKGNQARQNVREAFLVIHSLNAVADKTVSYPVTEKQLESIKNGDPLKEGFKWFGDNHPNITNRYLRTNMRISETLPTILEEAPVNRQEIIAAGVKAGEEYRATIKKISGKSVNFAIENAGNTNLKMGESGMESITKKNYKEFFDEGSPVILKNGGTDPVTGKQKWVFVRVE